MAILPGKGSGRSEQRIGRIILGYGHDGTPFYVDDMGGRAIAILKDAIIPTWCRRLRRRP